MDISVAHHIKGIRPALKVMAELGFNNLTCLQGTGLSLAQLEEPKQGISVQQEFAFYRRLLSLSGDTQLGLKLGRAYKLENYGVLGYAILSAQTLGEALTIAREFGYLSFSHFQLGFTIADSEANITMSRLKAIDPSLLTLFEDRDCSAILAGTMVALGQRFPIKEIKLMHDANANKQQYADFFQCPVSFNQTQMSIIFDAQILQTHMPLRDPETSEYCRKQCQQLLKSLTRQSSFVDEVRRILLATPGEFPNIQQVSQSLNLSERSLRRRLKEENQQFQNLLNEARFQLAKEYLDSELSLERIANLLGYSEAANFSHAFKRWSGHSPQGYRSL